MRSLLLASLFALLLAAPARAELCAEWSASDTWRQAAGTTLYLVDWAQTREFTAAPETERDCTRTGTRYQCSVRERHGEQNPLLGKHPSPEAINAYFASAIALHLLTSCWLAPDTRGLWQSFILGMELTAVWNNHQLGVRISGSF